MRFIKASLVLLCFFSSVTFGQKSRVGVLDFVAKGVSDTEAEIVGELFRSELVNSGNYNVLDRANMDNILNEMEFQQSGCTESECAIEIGKILNMQFMFYGSLMKLGESYIISVGIVNVETSQIVQTAKEKFAVIDNADVAAKKVIGYLSGKTQPTQSPTPAKETDAKVEIKSTPSSAKVYVNGEEKGQTPLNLTLPPGKHTIKVDKTSHGYEIMEKQVSLSVGNNDTQWFNLNTGWGWLSVNTTPEGADIYLDDNHVGKTPYLEKIKSGPHKLAIELKGYEIPEEDVYITLNKTNSIVKSLNTDLDYLKKKRNSAIGRMTADFVFSGIFGGLIGTGVAVGNALKANADETLADYYTSVITDDAVEYGNRINDLYTAADVMYFIAEGSIIASGVFLIIGIFELPGVVKHSKIYKNAQAKANFNITPTLDPIEKKGSVAITVKY